MSHYQNPKIPVTWTKAQAWCLGKLSTRLLAYPRLEARYWRVACPAGDELTAGQVRLGRRVNLFNAR